MNKSRIKWMPKRYISCVILDSPFANLKRSIKFMISNKSKNLPSFLVDLVLNMLSKDIEMKIGVQLSSINPEDY